jgi:anhydro-N-acetylmuramic acid kinase
MANERIFVGLYSGWATDGVDAAMIAVSGRGQKMKVRQLHQSHLAYPQDLRRRIMDLSAEDSIGLSKWVALNQEVSTVFAEAAEAVIKLLGRPSHEIHAVGASGQIVCRLPRDSNDKNGVCAIVELGLGSRIAARTGLPVAWQFAQNDAAAGGLGGPVQAWADWILFHDKRLSRACVDLGGITSLTLVGGDSLPMDVVAMDVGPGTLLIDALTEEHYGRPFDADGAFASRGKPHPTLLNELLANPYFQHPPPKVTERGPWGGDYFSRFKLIAERHRCREEDLVATATEFIARSIANAVGTLTERPHEVILSGGGAKNIFLATRIRALLSPSSTINCEKFGYGVRGKGAVCMAVLAAARVDNVPIYCPFATAAKSPTIWGSLVAWPAAMAPKSSAPAKKDAKPPRPEQP